MKKFTMYILSMLSVSLFQAPVIISMEPSGSFKHYEGRCIPRAVPLIHFLRMNNNNNDPNNPKLKFLPQYQVREVIENFFKNNPELTNKNGSALWIGLKNPVHVKPLDENLNLNKKRFWAYFRVLPIENEECLHIDLAIVQEPEYLKEYNDKGYIKAPDLSDVMQQLNNQNNNIASIDALFSSDEKSLIFYAPEKFGPGFISDDQNSGWSWLSCNNPEAPDYLKTIKDMIDGFIVRSPEFQELIFQKLIIKKPGQDKMNK